MRDERFRTIVYCEDTMNEVVAEVSIHGPTMDVLHLHNTDEMTGDTLTTGADLDSQDVEAFRVEFYGDEALNG